MWARVTGSFWRAGCCPTAPSRSPRFCWADKPDWCWSARYPRGKVARRGARFAGHRAGRGGPAGVGGHRGSVRIAVSSAGAALQFEDRVRSFGNGGVVHLPFQSRPHLTPARASALRIETPEGVVFSLRLASPVLRALAWGVDALVLAAAATVIEKSVRVFAMLGTDWATALTVFLYFAASMAYAMIFEWYWRGQTLGKRLFGLRVVDAQGLRLRPAQVVLRNLLRAIDFLPAAYLVGVTACLLSRKGQRLGDLAANTVVLREAKLLEPDVEQIAPVKYNSLLAFPHLAARLRSRVDPEAVRIAVTALAMRDGYEPPARVELFGELAGYFRALVGFPEEAVEGLTDEQYVRSAVRAIYGR